MQAAFVSMFVFVAGCWAVRRWLRSAPRAAKPPQQPLLQLQRLTLPLHPI